MRFDRRKKLLGAAGLSLLASGVAVGAWLRGRRIPTLQFAGGAGTAPLLRTDYHPDIRTRGRRATHMWPAIALIGAALLAVALAAFAWRGERNREDDRAISAAVGGDPARAIPIMLANGCAGCHTIPGVPSADGNVGPRLDAKLADKIYIGGRMPNTPANLVNWIRDARSIDPHTAMPSTRITDQQARDIAAYLYTLR